ncbi:hypothetical protein MKW94_017028 [Papaver nudicaule]|uniref:PGG domain-containing protein n=1 Tax=Papaver nudicaule TaxID=74823 RepID=A0AA42B0E3_PAPNU|nr:hypothetical protein [Papaver nudicaule]
MDQRLFDAAQTGNLELLKELLTEDRQILEKVALGSETPLDIAVLAGKTEFAREVLKLKPKFATELNKDGYSPIHVASASGYVEIVKELLLTNVVGSCNLCCLKDIEGRTALHCAVIKGRISVIRELINSACSSDCVRQVTARNETVLHLCIKNNQFEALKVLLESVDDDLLNAKDRGGNTLLHLAISKRHCQIIEYLLLNQATVNRLEINSKNSLNLTALDIFDLLLTSSCEVHDIEIRETLRNAGAERSRNIVPNDQQVGGVMPPKPAVISIQDVPTAHQDHVIIPIRREPITSRATKILKDFSKEIFGEIENSTSETRNALMVVAVLIATITYQGGINPPGGVWQDHSHENNSTNTTNRLGHSMHHAGKAVMVYERLCFILFMVFNTVGFFTSLIIISLLTSRFPLKAWLRLAVISMATAFGCGMCFIASFSGCIKIFLLLFFCSAVLGWYYWWIEKIALVTVRRLNNSDNRNYFRRIIHFIASHSFRPNNAVQDEVQTR